MGQPGRCLGLPALKGVERVVCVVGSFIRLVCCPRGHVLWVGQQLDFPRVSSGRRRRVQRQLRLLRGRQCGRLCGGRDDDGGGVSGVVGQHYAVWAGGLVNRRVVL